MQRRRRALRAVKTDVMIGNVGPQGTVGVIELLG